MENAKEKMMEINQLCNEVDGLYHLIAQNYGLSDSTFWILYILHSSDAPISQADLCNQWFFSKQTVNSSVSSLVKKGSIRLENVSGTRNKKNIVLTDAGLEFCSRAIGETLGMECTALSRLGEKECETFIALFQKWMGYMQDQYDIINKRQ